MPKFDEPVRRGNLWVFPDGRTLPVVSGGDGPTEDEPIARPEDLNALTADQLTALRGRVVARMDALRAADRTIATAREYREMAELANDCASLISEIAAPAPELVEPAAPEAPAAPVAEAPPAPVAEVPAPAEAPAPAPAAEVPAEPLAHAAAAATTLDQLEGDPAPAPEAIVPPTAVFVASAGLPNQTAGAEIDFTPDSLGGMMEAVQRSTLSIRESGIPVPLDQRSVRLASASFAQPGAVRLSQDNGPAGNDRIINETPFPADGHVARTAAICGPSDIQREIDFCLGLGRPILGLFRQIPSEHGSFQFTRSIGLGPVQPGVVIWTDADQAAVDEGDPSTWKPCVEVTCPTYEQVCPTPIPSCLIADVFVNFSSRETIQDWVRAIGVQTERVAEGDLLRKIDLYSSNYTVVAAAEDAIPHIYDALSTFIGMAENVNRLGDIGGYVAIIPAGLRRRLGLSRFRRQFSGNHDTLAEVMDELGIRWIETPDWVPALGNPWGALLPLNAVGRDACLDTPAVAPAAAVALPPAPDHWRIRLIDPRSAFFFSPENFAFGMERDPQLMRQNKMQWFGELFEGLGKRGCAPWFTFDIQLCPDGTRAQPVAPISCGALNPLVALSNTVSDAQAAEMLATAAAAEQAGLAGASEQVDAVGKAVEARKSAKS